MGKWDGEGGVGSGGGKGDFGGHAGRATREGGDSFAGGDRDGAGSRTCNGRDELGHCLCWAEISEGRGEDLQSVVSGGERRSREGRQPRGDDGRRVRESGLH